MSRILAIFALIYFLALGSNLAYSAPEQQQITAINIFSSESLSLPLTKIAAEYAATHNIIINLSFAPSIELATRIEDGEAAEIFISSDPDLMKQLKLQGLIALYSQVNLLENHIVLISSTDVNAKDINIKKMILDGIKKNDIILASPTLTALGRASREYLRTILTKFDTNYVNSSYDVSEKVRSSKNTIGIAYYSDALHTHGIKIIEKISTEKYNPIIYQGAIVLGESMNEARDFLKHLESPEAEKMFEKYGFEIK